MKSNIIIVFVVLAFSLILVSKTEASCNCGKKGLRSAFPELGYGYEPYPYGEKCVCTRDNGAYPPGPYPPGPYPPGPYPPGPYPPGPYTSTPGPYTSTPAPYTPKPYMKKPVNSKVQEVVEFVSGMKDVITKQIIKNAIAAKTFMIEQLEKKLDRIDGYDNDYKTDYTTVKPYYYKHKYVTPDYNHDVY